MESLASIDEFGTQNLRSFVVQLVVESVAAVASAAVAAVERLVVAAVDAVEVVPLLVVAVPVLKPVTINFN